VEILKVECYDDGTGLLDMSPDAFLYLTRLDVKIAGAAMDCTTRQCSPHEEGDNCYKLIPPSDWDILACEEAIEGIGRILNAIALSRAIVLRLRGREVWRQ